MPSGTGGADPQGWGLVAQSLLKTPEGKAGGNEETLFAIKTLPRANISSFVAPQLNSNAGRASSSAPRGSAPTQPSSAMETTTARTTRMKPTVVGSPGAPQTPAFCSIPWSRDAALTRIFPDIHVCLPSQFKCTNTNRCIPGIFRCNGQDNCGDGEDEKDCREWGACWG